MKAKFLCGALLLSAALLAGSCNKEEGIAPAPEFELVTEIDPGMPVFIVPGTSVELKYTAENATVTADPLPEGWNAEVDAQQSSVSITAAENAAPQATLTLTAVGGNGQEITETVGLYCLNHFDDPNGVFVLNEGNMSSENGSLTYITPEGYVFDDAYKTVNGSELGNVAQDMAICDGNIYVISQNGDQAPTGTQFENDGMLVVMDARTLKRKMSFTKEELSALEWPSHIAVLDEEHVYIRDNKGIYRLDTKTKALTFITGSEKAPKTRFAVMNGKVYTYRVQTLMGSILEIGRENDSATKISLPYISKYDVNQILGIQPADDGRIWIMSFGTGKPAIGKFDPSTKKIVQNKLNVKPSVGSAGTAFAVRGNDVFYTEGTTIYRITFDESQEQEAQWLTDITGLDDNAGQFYNGLGIHPVTGSLYANSIKSFALFGQNQIWVLDPETGDPVDKYENYTNFPAGFFFPAGR